MGMAERPGFEPGEEVYPLQLLSRQLPSATRPPLLPFIFFPFTQDYKEVYLLKNRTISRKKTKKGLNRSIGLGEKLS
jgi:hypothetical protein